VDTDRIAQKVPLKLSRRVFSTSLIVLSGQGIYVILGMRWMKMHKAILDIASIVIRTGLGCVLMQEERVISYSS
jgi:hypothetical protein